MVLIVEVVKISIGIYKGKISKFIKMLFFCNFIVSLVLIVLMKFSNGVFNNNVRMVVNSVEFFKFNNKVNIGVISIRGSFVII